MKAALNAPVKVWRDLAQTDPSAANRLRLAADKLLRPWQVQHGNPNPTWTRRDGRGGSGIKATVIGRGLGGALYRMSTGTSSLAGSVEEAKRLADEELRRQGYILLEP